MEKEIHKEKNRKWVFVGLYLGGIAPAFCTFARSIILPEIMTGFNGMKYYAIVLIIAALAMSIVLPIAGKLGDIFGRKRIYALSLIAYCISLGVCSAALNVYLFALGILLTGVFYGFLSANQKLIIGDITTEEERPKYIGYCTTVDNMMVLAAPIIGGFISDTLSWRLVYGAAIPVCLMSLICIVVFLDSEKKAASKKVKIDIVGIGLFILAIGPMLLLLSSGGVLFQWASMAAAVLLAVSLVGLYVFVRWENKHPSPIISMELFRNRRFSQLFIMAILVYVTVGANINYMPVFIQNVMGYSATASGMLLMPKGIAGILVSAFAGLYLSRKGRYKQLLCILLLLGIGGNLLLSFCGVESGAAQVVIATIVTALGASATTVIAISLAQRILPQDLRSTGISLIVFTGSFGMSIGAAVGGLVSNNIWRLRVLVPEGLAGELSPHYLAGLTQREILRDVELIGEMKATLPFELHDLLESTIEGYRQILAQSLSYLFLITAALALAAFLIAYFSKMYRSVVHDS